MKPLAIVVLCIPLALLGGVLAWLFWGGNLPNE